MFEALVLVLTFALEATAGAVPRSTRSVHGFEKRWLAPRTGPIKLHIALRQADGGAAVERQLIQASDPNSAGFRQHLTGVEAGSLSTPAQGSVHTVEYWLQQHGLLKDSSLYAGLFEIDTTIRQVEKLLNTTYFVYSDGNQDVIRTELYHLPDHVSQHVDFVTPTTHFPRSALVKASLDSWSSINTQYAPPLERRDTCGANDNSSPTCIRQVYGINYTAVPDKTTFAVYATEGASFNNNDLQNYLKQYNPPAAAASATYQVVGSGDPANPGGIEAMFETALDTQTLLGLAWPAQGILYNRGGVFGPNVGQTYDNFVQFLTELMTNETYPSVISFSESTPEDRMDPTYAKRLCNMMAQIGTRGITLLFSSGNNGPNGDQPTGEHKMMFEPKFPASCPWVLSVGGTTNLADESGATKSTIPLLSRAGFTASGGGFSNLFPAPSWQAHVVSDYINKHIPTTYHSQPGFNASGRGIPDVSAFSTAFPTFVNGVSIPIGGTSAAAPTWAAVIALLNDYEASQNRSALGFVNPWLYSLTSGLKDITKGGNNAGGCNFLAGCRIGTPLGYDVTEGWDPVTGLGSPQFSRLVAQLDGRGVVEDVIRGYVFGINAI